MKRTVLALFTLLLCTSVLLAQTNTTSLSGVVLDPSNAVVPGATVTLTNSATGSLSSTATKGKGEFSFEQVIPGTYEVRVNAKGFAEEVIKTELLVSTPAKLTVNLTVGSNEVINVETASSELNSTDATLGKAFNSAQVSNLPYLANNVTYLLSLQPGVLALDSGAQTGGQNTDSRTGIVNGARQDQSNITLDGVDDNDQIFGYAFQGTLRATRDSVEEFRVTTTNPNADAGRSSGAQVSLVTKSGTNAFHGSAYEFYRDPATTSNNWFNKQAQLQEGEPNVAAKVLQHTFGGTFGLPIKKDKLFFFGAYEAFKQASDVTVGQIVPSTIAGGGLVTGNVIYQACPGSSTTCTAPTNKTLTPADIAQLDGRASNSDCLTSYCYAPQTNAAAIAYFKTFPLSNSNGAGDGYNTGGYNFTSPAPISQITNIVRLDYNITGRQSVFVRGNLQSDNQTGALQFPGSLPTTNIYSNNKGIAAGHIWSINDRMTNNARYGFTRLGYANRGAATLPYVSFGAFSEIQPTTRTSIYQVTTNNFADDFTITKGRHTIQVGTNLTFVSNGQYFDSPLLAYANISPNLLATAAIANQGGSYDPGAFNCADCGTVAAGFSNFYNQAIIANIGAIETSQSGTEFNLANNQLNPLGAGVVPTHTFHNFEQEYYAQDQWKVTPQLSLTFGLRYVYLGVPSEINGQQIAPAVSADTFLGDRAAAAAAGTTYVDRVAFRAGGSKNGEPDFWSPQGLNFAPRFAFAWTTPDNKTSIRGGFALAYDHFGSGIIDNYQSNPQSLFSLSQINLATYQDIDSNPRFTGYNDVPAVAGATGPIKLPYTPADNPFTFDYSINDRQKTPYAETFNLTVQHEVSHNMVLTASYVGRLGRHLIQNVDIAMPTNLYDQGSAQSYFQAATAYAKMIDAGVDPSVVPDSGYFHNVFPNFVTGQTTGPAANYKGAQAYYYVLSNNRGNETNALYQADTDPTASPANQSNRFFFPQTSSIYVQSTTGASNYHALQLSVRQSLRYGLEYDVNYTYGKSMDEGSDPERNGTVGNSIVNAFSPHQWYAVSDFDVRHNITANYTIPLPIGKGAAFFNHGGVVDWLFGGIQLNGVVHYSTGFPFSAVADGNWGTNFAVNSNMVQTGKIPTGGHHYDPVNQVETSLNGISSADAHANLRFAYPGEAGQRNNFRSDGYLSIDDGLSKNFHVWREAQFRISAEVFNVINTNRFAVVQSDGTSANFGVYLNSTSSQYNVSAPTSSLLLQPRQMQFSGKFIF